MQSINLQFKLFVVVWAIENRVTCDNGDEGIQSGHTFWGPLKWSPLFQEIGEWLGDMCKIVDEGALVP